MGVVSESAYFTLGSPACIALVEMDFATLLALFFDNDLAIVCSLTQEKALFLMPASKA